MNKAILVINAGSSSIKFAVFIPCLNDRKLDLIYRGQIEGISQNTRFTAKRLHANGVSELLIDDNSMLHTHDEALQTLLVWIEKQTSDLDLIAVGHRVVHGGDIFSESVIVTDAVFTQLEALVPLAPLHQPHNLAAIKALKHFAPDLIQVACFDTAFHRSMPNVAQSFALPRSLTAEGIRPYGFHGFSYEYIASVIPELQRSADDRRVIVAHLGHGASLCAIVDGKSVATTMTFTPLEGVPMATRCGSIDPGVLLYLMSEKGMSVDEVIDLLSKQSGLLGVSGLSGDMRKLLASDNPHAAEAIDMFVYRVAREVGSLSVAAGGLDMLVFTGGIGEHSIIIRERVCAQLEWLGVCIDITSNNSGCPKISKSESPISIWVVPANEELVIANHAYKFVRSSNASKL